MPEDPRIGTTVGGYRITSQIGRGGMSVVYEAHHPRLDRKVALKLLTSELASSDAFRERFITESRVAASIDHPNIVPIYEAGEAEGEFFIAMQLVRGTDLGELIDRQGPLSNRIVVSILSQIAAALDTAHERGLVHRDVKPANILVVPGAGGRDPHAYLTDFGLTRQAVPEEGSDGRLVGTLGYVAPEQIEGKIVDGRADVYSLGCVAYECLTGKPPFERESDVAVLWAHVHDDPAPAAAARQGLSSAVDGVLNRALAKQPDRRYGSCTEFVRDLAGAVGEQARGRRRRRGGARHWWVRGGVAAAAIAAAAAGLILFGRGSGIVLDPRGNVAVAIDPATNEIAQSVGVGEHPSRADLTGGSLWVTNLDDASISRVDISSGKVPLTLELAARPTDIAVGYGGIWVATFDSGLLRIDEEDRSITGIPLGSDITAVAAGEGSIWATTGRTPTLTRVDPVDNAVLSVASLDATPVDIAVGGGAVWVASPTTSSVIRVDAITGTVVDEIGLIHEPTSLAVGDSAVWIVHRGEDSVSRIDPLLNRPVAVVNVGDGPTEVSATGDAAWVTNTLDGTISRIDPNSNRVVATIETGAAPLGAAAGQEGIWFTLGEP